MIIKNFFIKNGFLKFMLIVGFVISSKNSAQASSNTSGSVSTSWSGIRMITLGIRYMTEMPTIANEWIIKDLKNTNAPDKVIQERKNMAASVSEGMINAGKALVFIGAAKEFKDCFDYKGNPNNPLNDTKQYNAESIKLYQQSRIKLLQSMLVHLRNKLVEQKIEAQWLVDLFDKAEPDTLSEASLRLGVGVVGEVLERFKVYGIGVQVSSNYPVGAMVSAILGGRMANFAKYTGKVSYEDSHGILYYLKRGTLSEDEISSDPLYAGLPMNHPLVEAAKRDNHKFAATTYEQGGVQVEGVSYARGGSSTKLEIINVTVRLTFFASSEPLKNFNIMNLGKTVVTEISAQNNMSNIIADDTRKNAALKTQELIESTLDKSKHFSFLSKNVQVAGARLWGQVDEETGEPVEVPHLMLRVSIGNYSRAASKSRENNDIISLRGTLGSLSINANQ